MSMTCVRVLRVSAPKSIKLHTVPLVTAPGWPAFSWGKIWSINPTPIDPNPKSRGVRAGEGLLIGSKLPDVGRENVA